MYTDAAPTPEEIIIRERQGEGQYEHGRQAGRRCRRPKGDAQDNRELQEGRREEEIVRVSHPTNEVGDANRSPS